MTSTLTLTKSGNLLKIVEDGDGIIFQSLEITPKFTYNQASSTVSIQIGSQVYNNIAQANLSIAGSAITSAATLATQAALIWADPLATSVLVTKKTTVTAAQIRALNTTPITLVAAPGAGYAIQPLGFMLKYTYATAVFATNTNAFIYYTGIAGSKVLPNNAILAEVASADCIAPAASLIFSAGDIANKALLLTVATGDPTGATAAGTLDVYVTYNLVTV